MKTYNMLWNSHSIWLIISKYLYSSNSQTGIKEDHDSDGEKRWNKIGLQRTSCSSPL